MASITLLTQAMKVFIAETVYSAKKAREALLKKQKNNSDAEALYREKCKQEIKEK